MMIKRLVYPVCLLVCAFAAVSTGQAQKYELHPYAGGFFPGETDFGEFKSEGIYGLKANVNLTDGFELEGNAGYINHFEPEGFAAKSRAALWEVAGNVLIPTDTRMTPYVTLGVGGLTSVLDADLTDDFDDLIDFNDAVVFPGGNRLDDGDTFFMISYGGGLKADRLWGPVGLRFGVRGRTLPNIFADSMTWLETTGGITLSWGE